MEATKEARLARARLIMEQLGGIKFRMMTGAKEVLATEKGVQFMIPQAKKIRKVSITLDPNDLYTVAFYSLRRIKGMPTSELISSTHMVSADKLQAVFTEATGLDTHL